MTGQDAVNSSLAFSEKFPITGSVLTKMDGNSGGGAALSIKHITGKPIKFMTSGESIDKIEKFDAERVARRILGLGEATKPKDTHPGYEDRIAAMKIFNEKLRNNPPEKDTNETKGKWTYRRDLNTLTYTPKKD